MDQAGVPLQQPLQDGQQVGWHYNRKCHNSSLPVPPQPELLASLGMTSSYFKPKFTGKQEEDAEAHLLRIVDWMDAQNFTADQQVRRFPLSLAGKTRLLYQTIHPFQDV